jgi:hypothetical protein
MAQRSRASLKKRQRELQRQERQRDKVARREQRKLEKTLNPEGVSDLDLELDPDAAPSDEDSASDDTATGDTATANQ